MYQNPTHEDREFEKVERAKSISSGGWFSKFANSI